MTENRLWTGPQVIKTTKFEESRTIMERQICKNPLIIHAYQYLIIDVINDNHIEHIRSEWPEACSPTGTIRIWKEMWPWGNRGILEETVAVWLIGCSGCKPLLLIHSHLTSGFPVRRWYWIRRPSQLPICHNSVISINISCVYIHIYIYQLWILWLSIISLRI